MPAERTKLGEAYVEIKADLTQMGPGLEAAKAEFSTTASEIGREADEKIGGGFRAAGVEIKSATAGVRGLSTAISSVAGVWTSMVGVVGLVVGGITAIVTAADHWLNSSKQTNEELEKSYRTVADIEASFARRSALLRGESEAQLATLDILEALRKTEQELYDRRDEGLITAEKHVELLERARELSREEIALVKRLEEERKDAARKRWEADRQAMLDNIEKQKQAQAELARREEERQRKEEEQMRERERREIESAQRQAAALSQAFDRAINTIRSRQILDEGNIAGPLQSLQRSVDIIAHNIQNIPISG